MTIKNMVFSILFVILIIGCGKKEDDISIYKDELENYAKNYMKELKSVLVANMQEGGPFQAVNVCSDTAAKMTDELSTKMGVTVKRISFKNRNVHNFPKSKEIDILKEFEAQNIAGKLDAKSHILVANESEGKKTVTFAKPIFVEAPCLNCHGTDDQISPDVKEILTQKYPADKAKAYKIGDLRGAITVTKDL